MKKVVIIGLIVLAVLVIAVLGVRPGGTPESVDAPPYVELIDDLAPKVRVNDADVAGQDCWDASGVLTVPSGVTCRTALPDKATQLRVCVAEGVVISVKIDGSQYASQEADLGKLGCANSEPIRLYDDNSSLFVTCQALGVPCRLQLL